MRHKSKDEYKSEYVYVHISTQYIHMHKVKQHKQNLISMYDSSNCNMCNILHCLCFCCFCNILHLYAIFPHIYHFEWYEIKKECLTSTLYSQQRLIDPSSWTLFYAERLVSSAQLSSVHSDKNSPMKITALIDMANICGVRDIEAHFVV